MNYTQNYQLCLWDEDDRILMEDFNSDNEKTDAAMAGFGNCKIVHGSYIGTGEHGGYGISLAFSGQPLLVLIGDSGTGGLLVMARGVGMATFYSGQHGGGNCMVNCRWDTPNTVTWESPISAEGQANTDTYTYYYVALLAAGE